MTLTTMNPDQVNLADCCDVIITEMSFLHPKKHSVVVISPSDLPDIVTAGVLQGFYPRDVKVSFKKSSGKPSSLACAPELPVHPRIPAHPRIPTITINRSDISSESERI